MALAVGVVSWRYDEYNAEGVINVVEVESGLQENDSELVTKCLVKKKVGFTR